VQKNKKGLVVCINKWDLVSEKTNADIKAWEQSIRERMAPFQDFPILFVSALTKQRIYKVMETALAVYDNKQRKVPTAQLNERMLPLIENYPPPAIKGKYIKVKYCTQLPDTQIPTFVFFANLPQYVKEPYRRFLENKLRQWWDFKGTPVQLFFRSK
jgi:GTP-binding protein